MGDEREPVNCERIIHHSSSFFVWKWRSKRNQNIIMFPKMCLFKNWKLGKLKVIQDLEKCQHRLQTSPNNWKRWGGKDMEVQGPVPPETDSSPFRIFQCGCSSHRPQSVVHWDRPFVEFPITEKCESPICWNISDQKRKLVLWPWSGYLCNFSWKDVKHKSSKVPEWWLSIWQPCDTGLRPPFVGLGFMAKLENWKLPSWCFRGSWRSWGVWLHMRSKKFWPWFPIPPFDWRVEWH